MKSGRGAMVGRADRGLIHYRRASPVKHAERPAATGIAHGKPMKSYLIMMGVRLLEMRRILKPTGSIYLHCDPTASHYPPGEPARARGTG